MTNSIRIPQVFNHPQFGKIRTIIIDSKPWFVGKDVANALGYLNPTKACKAHIHNELDKLMSKMDTGFGVKRTLIINESGFYSLVLSSKLPQAQEFKHWVTSEVLPQIRQTGGYIPATNPKTGETLSDAEILAMAMEIKDRTLKLREEKIRNLESKIADDAPKVEFANTVMEAEGGIRLGDFAKMLASHGYNIGAMKLISFLRKKGYFMRNSRGGNVPYQRYVDRGYFTVHESTKTTPSGYTFPIVTIRITGKGQEHLINKFFS